MKIGVIILNYNSFSDTIKLVSELQRQTIAYQLEIIIVDNDSPNGSYEKLLPLQEKNPQIKVLQTGKNCGYAQGNNYGLEYLYRHTRPDYVAIMNNDIVLPTDCLEKLSREYATIPDACIIAPLQRMPDGRIYSGGMIPRFRDDLKNLFYLYRYLHKSRPRKNNESQVSGHNGKITVDIIPGSLLFASMERFKEIGFFYPETFLFVEERFIGYATRRHGYNNYILTDQTYLHIHSKTINTTFTLLSKYRFQYKGWLLFTRKCRRFGHVKAPILWFLIQYSLFEIWLISALRNLFSKNI